MRQRVHSAPPVSTANGEDPITGAALTLPLALKSRHRPPRRDSSPPDGEAPKDSPCRSAFSTLQLEAKTRSRSAPEALDRLAQKTRPQQPVPETLYSSTTSNSSSSSRPTQAPGLAALKTETAPLGLAALPMPLPPPPSRRRVEGSSAMRREEEEHSAATHRNDDRKNYPASSQKDSRRRRRRRAPSMSSEEKKKCKCSRSPLRRKDCKHRGRGEGGRSARSRGRSPGKRDIAANAEVDSPELGASAAAPQHESACGGSRSPLRRRRSAGNTPPRLAQTAPSQRSEDAGPDRTTELKSPSRSRPRGNQQQNQVPSSAGRSPGKRDIAANAEVDSPELGTPAAALQNERARRGSRSPPCRQRSAGNTPLRLAQTARLQRSEHAGPDRTIQLSSPSWSPPRGNQQQNPVPLSASSAAALKQLHKQLQEKMVESKAAVARAQTLVAEERAIAAQLHPLVEQAKVTLWRPPSRSRSRSRRCTAAPPMHLSRSRSRGHRHRELGVPVKALLRPF